MSRTLDDLRTLRPERVCLIKPSSLGDVVNAFPALAALRELWPQAHLGWIINRSLVGLVDGHPDLDEVIPFDRGRSGFGPKGLSTAASFLIGLRRRRFDLAIDFQGLLRSGLLAAATGAKIRVGLSDFREGSVRFYSHRVPPPPEPAHAVDRMMALAAAFGADPGRRTFRVAMTDRDRREAREMIAKLPRPRVIFNLGARWITKRWPPERFAEVARRVVADRGGSLVAIGAPEDRQLVDSFQVALGTVPFLDLCARTTLPGLAALASVADLLVSNDTGPLHLAAAAGARVVGIYTCTDPKLNGPYGDRAIAVSSCVRCAASYVRTCPRLECMTELTADRVWSAVARQLDRARGVSAA